MIYAFGGRNFYSFRDDFNVDFRVTAQASERHIFQTDARGQKTNTVMAVFGANASGKTHLLQVLGFLQFFLLESATRLKPGDEIGEYFFKFSPQPDLTSELFIEFELEEEHYRYVVTFDPKRVLREGFYRRKARFSYLFERTWNGSSYDFKSQDFGEDAVKIPQRENASFLATALLLENPVARRFVRFFRSFYGNLDAMGRSNRHDPAVHTILDTAAYFARHPEYLDRVNSRIRNFDLGLTGIAIEEARVLSPEGAQESRKFPFGLHRHSEADFRLPLLAESRGTQALFVLLRYILPVLENGGLAYIDEFEQGLHSHMIPSLADLFLTPKHNPRGAQLIFSCHADYLIGHLEKYQIQLVEKDESGASSTYRLDDVRGVRNVDNHYAKYHAGAYGGVPTF